MDEPTVGAPITNASKLPADYEGYTVASVRWEPNDVEFKADQNYSVLVTLGAKDDYVFPKYVTPYINEWQAKIVCQSEQELKISYTFSKLLPVMPSMFFDDVKTSDWFYGDVEYAYYYRLMNGVGNNKFDPYGACTRGMIVTILCRFAKTKGNYKDEDCTMLTGFTDNSKVSNWAADSMSWAVGVGLVGGSNEKDGLYLMPQGNAQRCQVAAIFQRFCTNFAYYG